MFVQMIARTICTFFCLVCLLLANVATAQPAKKYALLIGVTNYQHARMNENPLKYPEADAKAVGELLKRSDYNVEVLLGKAATKKAIESALSKAGKQGTDGGVVLIGLFGHGVQYGADAYFCPFDAVVRTVKLSDGTTVRDDNGQPKLEPDPDSLVTMRSILDPLTTCGATNRVLMADCCREDPNRARGRNPFGTSLRVNDIPRGTLALFACSEKEQAFEHDDWKHGAFTYAFLKHAEELAQSGRVTSGSLTDRMYETVRQMVNDKTNGRETQTVYDIDNGRVELLLTPRQPSTLTNEIGMQFRLIPAGEFMMGSSKSAAAIASMFGGEAESFENEHPRHRVQISKPFYLGTYEVTVGQFRQFVDATGYKTDAETDGKGGWGIDSKDRAKQDPKYTWENPGFSQADNHPVVNVSWNDAMKFCEWLSKKTGDEYRLPTEAQWEYACRAGTNSRYYDGDDSEGLAKVGNTADGTARVKFNRWGGIKSKDGYVFTAPVGRFAANSNGLYDMHGNVSEWCDDWYGEDYYGKSPSSDPQGPKTGAFRVNRGGGWNDLPLNCRSAHRTWIAPGFRVSFLGFRVLRSSDPAGK